MFYLFYNSQGRITEYQQDGLVDDRSYIAVDDLPDDVFSKAVVNGQIVNYVKTSEEIAAELEDKKSLMRDKRRRKLILSDWTQISDSPLNDSKKAEWATYRQALRDLTKHTNWPNLEESDWPELPS